MSPTLIPLIGLLTLAMSPQALDVPSKVAAVAPFVGEDTAAVAHLDLARWQASKSARRLLGKLADDAEMAALASAFDGRVDALKKAGATDLFLLLDPADMPGYPVAVVPLAGGVDPRGVAEVLAGGSAMIRWPKAEAVRGAVVAGSAEALARLREARPSSRPELIAALASGGDAAVGVAIVPTLYQRRAIEESFPTLPSILGGGPIEAFTRGLTWASLAIATEPKAPLRVAARGRDAEAAKAILKVARSAVGLVAAALRSGPSPDKEVDAVAALKPEADGETVRLEVDLASTTALAWGPLLQVLEADRRHRCVDDLKQIGLAMHNYHSTHKTFPPAYVAGKDGKPLLSWRVLVLPFLEQKDLYDRFHLDESWDSPHNRELIREMPRVFACPAERGDLVAEYQTTYLAPRGPATIFPGAVGVKIKEVTDGTSNTILVAEAGDDLAVTWTKPDDWAVAPEFSTKGLFGHHPGGTNFGFGDGSVRFLKQSIAPKLLQALTSRNGGEVLNADDY